MNFRKFGRASLGALVFTLATQELRSQDTGPSLPAVLLVFPERQKERKSARWTLADWLTTKRTIEAQNSWLARHSNRIPLDAALEASFNTAGSAKARAEIGLMWLQLGLGYERSVGGSSFLGAERPDTLPLLHAGAVDLSVRLFGSNPQNTSLSAFGIYEYEHYTRLVSGPYAGWGLGARLQVYLAQWLGLEALYLVRFKRERVDARSDSLGGDSWKLLPFLELGAFRFFATVESRVWNFRSLGVETLSTESLDYGLGLKAYF